MAWTAYRVNAGFLPVSCGKMARSSLKEDLLKEHGNAYSGIRTLFKRICLSPKNRFIGF